MESLKLVLEVMREFQSRADFVFIYIEEAHPDDGWRFDDEKQPVINQHKTMDERMDAAGLLHSTVVDMSNASNAKLPVPETYVDTLDNSTNHSFGAIPERLAIVLNGRLHWLGGMGPFEYDVNAMRSALVGLFGEN